MRVALYQPDIPQNTGAMIRLAACLGVGLDIIEPCGFVFDDRKVTRSAMDYMNHVSYERHASWDTFKSIKQEKQRYVLMTTKASISYLDFDFAPDDILIAGRESAGVPDDVHEICEGRVCIPMSANARSLNVVNATSLILGEALRQTNGFKDLTL